MLMQQCDMWVELLEKLGVWTRPVPNVNTMTNAEWLSSSRHAFHELSRHLL